MIEIAGLTKRFGPITAVAGIDLIVGKGEVLGFLGPNGAGKTTTMKMLAGFLAPDGGSARVCGHDIETYTLAAQQQIWFLPGVRPRLSGYDPAAIPRLCRGDSRACRVGGQRGHRDRRAKDGVGSGARSEEYTS